MLASKLVTCCSLTVTLRLGQCRCFETMRETMTHLRTAQKIRKITRSLKMVSTVKFVKVERELKGTRVFGVGARQFYANVGADQVDEATTRCPNGEREKRLLVIITTDRGLCGAVHWAIIMETRRIVREEKAHADVKLVLIGDKARASLKRLFAKDILFSCNGIGRIMPTFHDAAVIAAKILSLDHRFDKSHILYNQFEPPLSYSTTVMPLYKLDAVVEQPLMSLYDSIDDGFMSDFASYSLVQLIYHALKESAASVQVSRMIAMDKATRNADEMIQKMTLEISRNRQAMITREIIESMDVLELD